MNREKFNVKNDRVGKTFLSQTMAAGLRALFAHTTRPLTPETQSINEKDFECFGSTGVNTTGTMFHIPEREASAWSRHRHDVADSLSLRLVNQFRMGSFCGRSEKV